MAEFERDGLAAQIVEPGCDRVLPSVAGRRSPVYRVRQVFLPPAFGGLALVEGVDVNADDGGLGVTHDGSEILEQVLGRVPPGLDEPAHQPPVLGEEPHGLSHTYPGRDLHQLQPVGHSGDPDPDGEGDAIGPATGHEVADGPGIEAHLGGHVRGVRLLVGKSLAELPVRDHSMSFGI